MTLALGLLAILAGFDRAVSGVTNRPFGRLVLGNWDAPGAAINTGANASTGGAYGPQGPTGPTPSNPGQAPPGPVGPAK